MSKQLRTISAHWCTWDLARQVVDNGNPGSVSKHRTALRLLDAIAEKAHPKDRHPNPWHLWDSMPDEQRDQQLAAFEYPIDPGQRTTVDLTPEQCDLLTDMVETYLGKAPTMHAKVLLPLLDAIEEAQP